MLSILADGFVYNPQRQSFTKDIIKLNYSGSTLDIYGYIRAWKEPYKMVELNKSIICRFCDDCIYSCDSVYIRGDIDDLHPECANIITNIINDTPVVVMKLTTYDKTELIPVYGRISINIYIRGVFNIEKLTLLNNVYYPNIYDNIIINYNVVDNPHLIECSICRNVTKTMFSSNYIYCSYCVDGLNQFKDKLFAIYALLRAKIVPDLNRAIIDIIISIYDDVEN